MLNDEEAEEQRGWCSFTIYQICFDLKLVTIELLFIVEMMELNKKCQAQNEKEGNQEATNA